MQAAPENQSERPYQTTPDRAPEPCPDGNGHKPNCGPQATTPWLSAEELQPKQRAVAPLDELDEALMESFPCSDPPCFSHSHA